MVSMPGLMVLVAAFTAANYATEDAIFQLETRQATFATVQRYPDAGNMQGYKFTVTARANGELPQWKKTLRDSANNIYVKTANGQYAYLGHTDNVNFASDDDAGLLLQPGDYFFLCSQWKEHILAVGSWASLETQSKYWSLPYSSLTFETVSIQGGGTSGAITFDVSARPDGSLPFTSFTGDLYRRNGAGAYELFCKGGRNSFLLPPGRYGYINQTGLSPANAYISVARGVWVAP